MAKLVPYLWFDKEAMEAAENYVNILDNSQILNSYVIKDTPSGDAETVSFRLNNLEMEAISAGPYFKLNPSVSLMVVCNKSEKVDRLYEKLSLDGKELMPLGEYPFSKRYAWIQDKYGLSWQLIFNSDMDENMTITPSLLFAGDACGRAEEAMDYYITVFKDAVKGYVNYYNEGEAEDERARINYGEIDILGLKLKTMDHGLGGDFTFNEAFSFMILCDNQEEIDYYWYKLSYIPEAEQCGWLKDKFGVSWQIVPSNMNDVYKDGTEEEIKRYTEAFLNMKKFDMTELEKARRGI